MNPKRNTPRHIILRMAKVKDKERTLKVAKERQLVTYKGVSITLSLRLPAKMEIHFDSSHNQNKDNNKFKNKKQPELTGN